MSKKVKNYTIEMFYTLLAKSIRKTENLDADSKTEIKICVSGS